MPNIKNKINNSKNSLQEILTISFLVTPPLLYHKKEPWVLINHTFIYQIHELSFFVLTHLRQHREQLLRLLERKV